MNFYLEAAEILSQTHGSIESRIFAKGPTPHTKRIYALISQSIKYKDILQEVILNAKLLQYEKKLTPTLALLLVHDLLLNKGGISAGKGTLKDAVLRHKARLHAEFVKSKLRRKITSLADLHTELPKWGRINPLVEGDARIYEEQVASIKELVVGKQYASIIPHVYAFHPSEDLASHPMYLIGRLVLQTMASCFPAYILDPQPGQTIIDACAAPGNKTSHLAALMQNHGTIFAYEMDKQRSLLLQRMMDKAHASIVQVRNENFLQATPCRVGAILLDPSCSGSGITSRLDYSEEDRQEEDQDRLRNLAAFQERLILHAMSHDCQRITYSTCSIHRIENEEVVKRVLSSDLAREHGWQLARAMPQWPRRGQPPDHPDSDELEIVDKVVRCSPEDGTIGFFVALFVRMTATSSGRKSRKRKSQKREKGKTRK